MNQATSYIDLSNIYSSNSDESHRLRDDEGYLRSPTEKDGRYMLLRSYDPNDGCNKPDMLAANTPCFRSGTLSSSSSIKICILWHLVCYRRSSSERVHRVDQYESSMDARTQSHIGFLH